MKKNLKKFWLLVSLLPLAGFDIPIRASNLFSTRFGSDFQTILTNIINILLGFAGLIALGYIIMGGYQIATAAGSEDRATHGRKTLTNAIIGLLIIILSYVILSVAINAAFGNVT